MPIMNDHVFADRECSVRAELRHSKRALQILILKERVICIGLHEALGTPTNSRPPSSGFKHVAYLIAVGSRYAPLLHNGSEGESKNHEGRSTQHQ